MPVRSGSTSSRRTSSSRGGSRSTARTNSPRTRGENRSVWIRQRRRSSRELHRVAKNQKPHSEGRTSHTERRGGSYLANPRGTLHDLHRARRCRPRQRGSDSRLRCKIHTERRDERPPYILTHYGEYQNPPLSRIRENGRREGTLPRQYSKIWRSSWRTLRRYDRNRPEKFYAEKAENFTS